MIRFFVLSQTNSSGKYNTHWKERKKKSPWQTKESDPMKQENKLDHKQSKLNDKIKLKHGNGNV